MKWNPARPFYFGLALVILATWIPFVPAWSTFIHTWRVDIAASIFLFSVLGYLVVRSGGVRVPLSLSKQELWLIVAPMAAFIAWSCISILWAPSWKSAAHHTLVWSEYLIFYLLIRYLVDEGRHFSKLTTTFTIALVLFSIPAIFEFLALQAFGGETYFRARFAKYGEQIVTLLPLLVVAVMRLSGRRLYAGLSAIGLLWLLIYCTAGRANLFLFACVIGSLCVVFFLFRRLRRYRMQFAVCIFFIAAAPIPLYLYSLAVSAPEVPILSRFNDKIGSAYSKDLRLLMNSVSFEMIRSQPVIGVGADNYGMQFNAYRQQYAASNPADPNLSYGEMGIVGHAHNEFLQITAELGIVGLGIFLWLLAGIVVMAARVVRTVNRRSPFAIAAVLGLGMFLGSSLVSAYSFRLMQNGLVFFFVLAVAAKSVFGKNESLASDPKEAVELRIPRFALAAGMAACLLLAVYSSLRVGSVILATRANYTQDLNHATELYHSSMSLDDENPDVRNNLAIRFFQEDRFAEAVPLLQESIRIGRAESTDFSYLASAQSLAGDNQGAEKTMAAAAALYPRSPFVLTRHAALLHLNGRQAESSIVFGKAREIDYRSANSWWTIINHGAQATTDRALRSVEYIPVMELQPQRSMYAVLDERYVRFPAEQLMFRRR